MFGTDDLNKAILSKLNSQPDVVPAGKKFALVVHAHNLDDAQAAIAVRVGDHWQVGEEVNFHGTAPEFGTSVMASW